MKLLNLGLYRLVIAMGVVIKNRAQRKFFSRDIYYAFAIPRVQMHEDGTLYTFHLREILNSARFEFISNAAKPLSMRVELAVSAPGVVITPE